MEEIAGGAGEPTAADRPHAGGPVVSSSALGMLIFVSAETMFFAGLLSAFVIGKANAVGWPPLGQPRASVALTGLNTLVLLASAVPLFLAHRSFTRARPTNRTRGLLAAAIALGGAFLALQGYEWARLLWFGLTLTSSSYGSFFYLLVGTHALHAIAALLALGWVERRLRRGAPSADAFWAVQIFWYFVVGLWPILYAVAYLT